MEIKQEELRTLLCCPLKTLQLGRCNSRVFLQTSTQQVRRPIFMFFLQTVQLWYACFSREPTKPLKSYPTAPGWKCLLWLSAWCQGRDHSEVQLSFPVTRSVGRIQAQMYFVDATDRKWTCVSRIILDQPWGYFEGSTQLSMLPVINAVVLGMLCRQAWLVTCAIGTHLVYWHITCNLQPTATRQLL